MSQEYQATISLWNLTEEFHEPGIQKGYTMENFDEERFRTFVDRLVEHYPEPFETIAESLEEPIISVGSPKPEQMNFQRRCVLCESVLENSKIHIEVMAEDHLLFLCRNCFLTLPKDEESLQEKIE